MDLVVTGDSHGLAVFASMEHPKMLIDTQIPFFCEFSVAEDGPWRFEIEQQGRTLDVSRLRCAYVRRPIMSDSRWSKMPVAARDFVRREWEQIVEGVAALCHLLPEKRLVTLGRFPQLAANKIAQLVLAREVGLLIPATCVTSSPDSASAFCKQGETVYKTLSIPVVDFGESGRGMIYTSRVDGQNFERVRHAPCLFQRNIAKDYEIRAAVVGDRVIAVRLNSQSTEVTHQDWRHAMCDVVGDIVNVPSCVERALVELHRRLQIPWGMVDMIVDANGQYIFLETNPDGAWLWLEQALGIDDITRALSASIQRST